MQAVGSANVYLLPVLIGRLPKCSFSRPSWWASILGPFLFSPERKTLGCLFFQIQEMHHGKETLLW
jgi:hypothetical protein